MRPPVYSTDLHEAVRIADLARVCALLDAGADVNATDWFGSTPLMLAAPQVGAGEARPTPHVLQCETNRTTKERFGSKTPTPQQLRDRLRQLAGRRLDPAAMQASRRAARDTRRRQADTGGGPNDLSPENIAVLRELLARGAALETRNREGHTALTSAAAAGRASAVALVLDSGALIDAEGESGRTALMHAAAGCSPAVVRLLLDRGASLMTSDCAGNTVLMRAASGGSLRVLDMLLAAGCKVNTRRDDGATALAIAAMDGWSDVCEHLRAAGAHVGFQEAVALCDLTGARRLRPAKPTRSRPRTWCRGLLVWAALEGKAEAVQLLLESGVPPDPADGEGPAPRRTPLMLAVMQGDVSTVRALLDAGSAARVPGYVWMFCSHYYAHA